MNQLWIRLSSNTVGNEKLMRDKERNQLKILVGENITRLSSLNGLTLEIYKNKILPKIISILLDSKDNLSQQYLMECIIHAFPDDYNIDCMEIILETITKLNVGVDVKSLIISLMEKLAKYVGDKDNKQKENIGKEIEKIFNLLKNTFSELISEDEKLGIDIEIAKVLELQIAFMKFTVNCCPEKDKLQTINLILASGVKILKIYDLKLTNNSIKLISKLLITSLECKDISIFQIENIFNLMNHLDFNSRSNFSLRIIESFIKNTANDKIDSLEKIQKILSYMKPLIEDVPDSHEIDEFQFDLEQTIVAKLVFVIGSHSPEVIYDILVELKNVFNNGGDKRKKYTFPSLANALLDLCYTISGAYDLQNNYLSDDVKTPIYLDKIQSIDISQINSSDIFYKTMMQIYTLFNEVVTEITKLNPELAFKTYLNASIQVNSIHTNKNQFEEVCVSFINESISIFQEGKFDSNLKYGLLTLLEGTLLNLNILSQENLLQFIQTLQNISQGLIKRNDQCNAMLNIAQLYYTLLGDKNKVVECLTKSKRFADFAITNPKMLILYVIILNKIIYFTEIDESEFIKTEFFEDIIETIKNHIQTISSENKETNDFLPSIQSYFDRTLDIIKTKKNEGKRKVYSEISNL
jgi:vacuolar protein sorting-associated protein 35